MILTRRRAGEAREWTRGVTARLGLTLNEAKAKIKEAWQEGFDFLGYTFGAQCYRKKGGRKYHHSIRSADLFLRSAAPPPRSARPLTTSCTWRLKTVTSDKWRANESKSQATAAGLQNRSALRFVVAAGAMWRGELAATKERRDC